MNKPNNIANKNFQKENKIMMTELKEKRFAEEKRGLNNLFYNSDKIKTNIINKRKNNNLFNLSNYIKSKNIEQIKREIQEINISRNLSLQVNHESLPTTGVVEAEPRHSVNLWSPPLLNNLN